MTVEQRCLGSTSNLIVIYVYQKGKRFLLLWRRVYNIKLLMWFISCSLCDANSSLLLLSYSDKLRPGQRRSAADSAAGVRRHSLPECHQMGSPELGRRRPQTFLQKSLQTPASWGNVHPGATAVEVLPEEEEADGKTTNITYQQSVVHTGGDSSFTLFRLSFNRTISAEITTAYASNRRSSHRTSPLKLASPVLSILAPPNVQ